MGWIGVTGYNSFPLGFLRCFPRPLLLFRFQNPHFCSVSLCSTPRGDAGVVSTFFPSNWRLCGMRVAGVHLFFPRKMERGMKRLGRINPFSLDPIRTVFLCLEQGSELPGSLFAPDPSYMLLLRARSLASCLSSVYCVPTEKPLRDLWQAEKYWFSSRGRGFSDRRAENMPRGKQASPDIGLPSQVMRSARRLPGGFFIGKSV